MQWKYSTLVMALLLAQTIWHKQHKGGKVYFNLWFHKFQPMLRWLQVRNHGGRVPGRRVVQPTATRKQKQRKEPEERCTLQRHSPHHWDVIPNTYSLKRKGLCGSCFSSLSTSCQEETTIPKPWQKTEKGGVRKGDKPRPQFHWSAFFSQTSPPNSEAVTMSHNLIIFCKALPPSTWSLEDI